MLDPERHRISASDAKKIADPVNDIGAGTACFLREVYRTIRNDAQIGKYVSTLDASGLSPEQIKAILSDLSSEGYAAEHLPPLKGSIAGLIPVSELACITVSWK